MCSWNLVDCMTQEEIDKLLEGKSKTTNESKIISSKAPERTLSRSSFLGRTLSNPVEPSDSLLGLALGKGPERSNTSPLRQNTSDAPHLMQTPLRVVVPAANGTSRDTLRSSKPTEHQYFSASPETQSPSSQLPVAPALPPISFPLSASASMATSGFVTPLPFDTLYILGRDLLGKAKEIGIKLEKESIFENSEPVGSNGLEVALLAGLVEVGNEVIWYLSNKTQFEKHGHVLRSIFSRILSYVNDLEDNSDIYMIGFGLQVAIWEQAFIEAELATGKEASLLKTKTQ